ncbi:MAG: hypothetical protein ACE5F9_11350 [Phycisphaerae bacterium]
MSYALDVVRTRTRGFAALAATSLLVAAFGSYLTIAVIIDHGIDGGVPLGARRVALALMLTGLLAMAITRLFVPLFRHISALYSARVIELANPDFRNALVTALQLAPRRDVHVGVVAGVHEDAARHLDRCDFAASVPRRPLRRAALIAGGSAVAFGLYALVAPKAVGPSVLRALGADLPAPTRTRVRVLAPARAASVVVGTPVCFEVELRGSIPAAVLIEYSRDEGRTWVRGQRLALRRVAQGDRKSEDPAVWRATKAGQDVVATLWYRVVAGDARAELRRLEVRPVPQVGEPTLRLTYPTYTGRSPVRRERDGYIDAVVGTRVDISARTAVPAGSARIVFYDGHGPVARQMAVEGKDHRELRASWLVDRDAEYEIRFSDAHGAENPNSIRYRQRGRPDHPPLIEQTSPGAQDEVAPDGAIDIRALITDDFGLTDWAVVYRVGSRGGRVALAGSDSAGPAVVKVSRRIPVSRFSAAAGDVIQLHLVALDNRHDFRDRPAYQESSGPDSAIRVVASQNARGPNKQTKQGDGDAHAGRTDDKNGASNGGEAGSSGSGSGTGGRHDEGDADGGAAGGAEEGGETGRGDAEADEGASNGSGEDGDEIDRFLGDNREKIERLRKAFEEQGDRKSEGSGEETGGDPAGQDSGNDQSGGTGGENDAGQDEGSADSDDGESVGQGASGDKKGTEKSGKDDSGDTRRDGTKGDETGQGEKPGGTDEGSQNRPKDKDAKRAGDRGDPAGETGASDSGDGKRSDDGEDKGEKTKTGQGKGQGSGSGKGDGAGPGKPGGSGAGADPGGDVGGGIAKSGAGAGGRRGGQPKGTSNGSDDANPPAESDRPSRPQGSDDSSGQPGGDQRSRRPESDEDQPPEDEAGPMEADGEFGGEGHGKALDGQDRDRARDIVDELDRRLRRGDIDPETLEDLGWTRAEALRFVQAFRRRDRRGQRDTNQRFTGRVREAPERPSGAEEQRRGEGTDRGIRHGLATDRRGRATAEQVRERQPEVVPPEYRDLLDEYYRSMGRLRRKHPKH